MTDPGLLDPAAGPSVDLRRALIAELEAAEAAFLALAPAAAIHTGRIRLRRARAIARIAEPAAPWTARRINVLAGDVMRPLSASRDAQAMAAHARALSRAAKGKAKRGLRRISQTLAMLDDDVAADDLQEAARDVRNIIALARALPALGAEDIQLGLERAISRARKSFRRATTDDESARHHWRKREKDRATAAQIFEAYWPVTIPRRAKLGRAVCKALGAERDAVLLLELLADAPTLFKRKATTKAVIKAVIADVMRRQRNSNRLGARLHRKSA